MLQSIELGKRSAEQGMDYATVWFIQSAHIIAKENFKQQNSISFYFPLMELGKITVKTHLLNSSLEIIRDLDEIEKISLERGQIDPLNQIIRFYFDLITVSISSRNYNFYRNILRQLEKTGSAIIDKRVKESGPNFCFQIRNIGFFCIENREETLSLEQIQLLISITERCFDPGFNEMAEWAIHSITEIGGFALKKDYEFVALSVIFKLDTLENKITANGLNAISLRTINSIFKIQQIAISNFTEDVVELCLSILLSKILIYKQSGNNDLSLHVSELLSEFKTEDSILFNKMMKKMPRRFCNEDYTTLQQLISSL